MTAEGQLQCSFLTIFSACSAPPRDIEVPNPLVLSSCWGAFLFCSSAFKPRTTTTLSIRSRGGGFLTGPRPSAKAGKFSRCVRLTDRAQHEGGDAVVRIQAAPMQYVAGAKDLNRRQGTGRRGRNLWQFLDRDLEGVSVGELDNNATPNRVVVRRSAARRAQIGHSGDARAATCRHESLPILPRGTVCRPERSAQQCEQLNASCLPPG